MKQNVNICIDYLKIRFDFKFAKDSKFYQSFAKLLSLTIDNYEEDNHSSFGYDEGYYLGSCINIFSGGEFTRNKYGDKTSLLELKGSACREFEELGGSWLSLFELISQNNGHCTRIDIAIDDFSNSISIPEIKQKIEKREYISRIRSLTLDNSIPIEEALEGDDEQMAIRLSKHDGFTATLGGRSSSQLCIYNKKAERLAHGYIVNYPSWIRYESRFYHKTAESALALVYKAMSEDEDNNSSNKYPLMCLSLLSGLITFIEEKKNKNLCLNKTWSKWESFTQNVEKCHPVVQSRLEKSIVDNFEWFYHTNRKILLKMLLSEPSLFSDFLVYSAVSGGRIFTSRDRAIVNNYRKSESKTELSEEDVKTFIKKFTKYKSDDLSKVLKLSEKYTYQEDE